MRLQGCLAGAVTLRDELLAGRIAQQSSNMVYAVDLGVNGYHNMG